MYIFNRTYIFIIFIIFFIGCSHHDNIEKKPLLEEKKIVEKNIVEKKKVEKKETKTKIKKVIQKKKKNIYKYCYKHKKIMTHASNYVFSEFKKAYFNQKNTVEAKAQVFLIENNSPTPFAQNINAALNSYKKQYELAKKYKCNLKKFNLSPLEKIKIKIKTIENKIKKGKKK